MKRYAERRPTRGVRLLTAARESWTYAALRALARWTEHSRVYGYLADDRVLLVLLGVFVLASAASVLASGLGAGVKLLSFLLLFAVVGTATQRRLGPPPE